VRTVFLGTTSFAVAVLERLAASEHRPALVVTRPDRPRGRGRRLSPPPAAEAARRLGIDLAQPASVNDDEARARIADANPEVVCVCAFGGLIKEPLLSAYRMLNVHPSLLPRWRGAAPIERAIMAGDEATGVTIMGVTAGLDSGPVYAQEGEEIRPQDSYGTLADRLQELGGALLVRVLDDLPEPVEQPEEGVTYAEKITPADRGLDPARPATELERQVRALSPHIGAQLRLDDGSELGVLVARAGPSGSGRPGTIDVVDRCPVLLCGEGALALLEVKPPGRQAMSGEAWLRGHRK
jgi:methionyl-tRNA formyltransferase